jgi:hypothetical protein
LLPASTAFGVLAVVAVNGGCEPALDFDLEVDPLRPQSVLLLPAYRNRSFKDLQKVGSRKKEFLKFHHYRIEGRG